MRRIAGRVASYCWSASKCWFCWISPPPQMMHQGADRQQRRIRRGVGEQVDGTHRVADEVRRVDAERLAEARHMPNPHPAAVDEVDDLRRLPEAQLVRRQHSILRGKRGDVAFPAKFGAAAELAAVQQHHRIAFAGFQVAGGQAVDRAWSCDESASPASLLDRDRVDRRTHCPNESQGRRDELELVDAVGGAVVGQRGQIPVLAEHQSHVTQAEQVEGQKHPLDAGYRVFDLQVVGRRPPRCRDRAATSAHRQSSPE